MNIVLIGYRGTGKTTVSEILRERLGLEVLHFDEILEARFGERIAAFVEHSGWEEFRNEEELLVQELSQMDGVILDTGGGVIVREKNIKRLRKNGFVVWLRSKPQSIARYIRNDSNRPSLTGEKSAVAEIREVLEQRTPLYRRAADFSVETDVTPLLKCVELIIQEWKKRNEALETR